MTTSDVDRMQHDLHDRLGRGRPPRRSRIVLAAAAVLLLVAVLAAGALWLRRTPPVPAHPQGMAPVPGIYLQDDGTGRFLAVIHADGTSTDFGGAQSLVHPIAPFPDWPWHFDGEIFTVDVTNELGKPCHNSARARLQPDGRILFDVTNLDGPGCGGATSFPAAIATRLSPASDAGRSVAAPGGDPTSPVTDSVQLEGIWLVEGSGIVLATDEQTGAGSEYLLDDDGEIDRAPDAKGTLAATGGGRVTLTAPGCADTVLENAVVRGAPAQANLRGGATGLSMTATVTTDPCNRFGGRTVLTWIRVL